MRVTDLGEGLVFVDLDDEPPEGVETISLLPALNELIEDLRSGGILRSEPVVPAGETAAIAGEIRIVDLTPALRRMMARMHRKGLVTGEEYHAFVALRTTKALVADLHSDEV